jgi:dihydrolipoamide dehydrogenase
VSEIFDVAIIGSGPGGYIAAIRAAQLGFRVACIEKEEQLGGTCLRVGCIPSKALLESSHHYAFLKTEAKEHGVSVPSYSVDLEAMQSRKNRVVQGLTQGIAGLFKKNKITRFQGTGCFKKAPSPHEPISIVVQRASQDEQQILAKRVIIATGSKEAVLPGIDLGAQRIGTSTDALAYDSVPEHLVVIGAGAIGLELGSVWSRLGAKVTVLEYADRILAGMDTELANMAQRIYAKQGLEFKLKSRVLSATQKDDACIVTIEDSEPIHCDRVLMAVGRVPNIENLGVDALGLTVDARGRIVTDQHFQTNIPQVFAIGDVKSGPMLAHKAEDEGVACVEQWATGFGHVDYHVIPYVVYTAPEVASVGFTEEYVRENNIPYKKGSFPFIASSRARAMGDTSGFVKVLAHKDTDKVLGVHIVGINAGEMIAEAAVSMSFGASSEDIARVCHAHPTLSEAFREACLAVDGRALNM